ncbi:MAG TPA: phasin family protein [Burkholderiales bacterium]|nr:phasin family protein [Burkholderiales bacterium]
MVQVNEQLAALSKSQLEATLRFTEIASESLEKLADLQFRTAKTAFADGLKTARQLGTVKDPSELAAVGGAVSQPAWEKAQAYAKSAYEVAAAAQAEISSLLEQQLSDVSKSVLGVLDGAIKNAPAGSESAVAAVKSLVQSASAAYESMLKATKQMVAMAETNAVTAAAHVAVPRKKAA